MVDNLYGLVNIMSCFGGMIGHNSWRFVSMSQKSFLFIFLSICLAAVPCLGAEDTAVETMAQTPAQAPVQTTAQSPGVAPTADQVSESEKDVSSPSSDTSPVLPFLENLLEDPTVDMAGCSAWYPCVHGGSVSCSSPTGTCISSGQGCGLVVCNGQSTFCPGACNTDWNCAQFCHFTYGSTDGYCSSTKCCVCL